MADGANPVYDKEVHSEIFSQGTLMLRLVIQISMLLAIPLMAVFLYIFFWQAPWYICYVLLFNILVGPVFSAGSVTGERERQTLDLLLTTTITPWQILWGKLVAGLRVSSVLTFFLLWPVMLACLMVTAYWTNLLQVASYFVIVMVTCTTTAFTALFFSVLMRKTSHSLMSTYMALIGMYLVPPAMLYFATMFFQQHEAYDVIYWLNSASPFTAALEVPLDMPEGNQGFDDAPQSVNALQGWAFFGTYLATTTMIIGVMSGVMIWLFNNRWRIAGLER
jgi:ABC-type transport system involved in multi-copper enzyme maturation permease subunit